MKSSPCCPTATRPRFLRLFDAPFAWVSATKFINWFRAKFFQQYRLFFRFHAPSKVMVLAWVNDEGTKQAYESNEDAYRVFAKMLANGHPPSGWEQLLAEAKSQSARLADKR